MIYAYYTIINVPLNRKINDYGLYIYKANNLKIPIL